MLQSEDGKIKIQLGHTSAGYYINSQTELSEKDLNNVREIYGIESVKKLPWDVCRVQYNLRPGFVPKVLAKRVMSVLTDKKG